MAAAKRRAKGNCEWCLKPNANQGDHIISTSHNLTHLDIQNCVWLCFYCHIKRKSKDAYGWGKMVEQVRGKEVVEKLYANKHKTKKKWSIWELIDIKNKLDKMFI